MHGKSVGDCIFAQHLEQLFQAQHAIVCGPAFFKQRLQRLQWRPDLGIDKFAGAKQFALAHHHAYQQCLGSPWQAGKLLDERLLATLKQIGIALLDPVEHLLEVGEVIERLVDGMGNHGKATGRHQWHWLYIQTPPVCNLPVDH
ncbi:hypothetical protein D9M71_689070 [compost metagenome]